MFGLQEGFINRKLVLGVEIEGMKIPVFQCDQGRFSIPDECDKDGLPEPAVDMVEPYAYNRFIEALDRRKSDLTISTYEDFLYDLL